MKKILLLFPFLMAATCADQSAPQQPIFEHTQQAIRDWKAQGHHWGTNCWAYQVYLHPVPQRDLPSVCGVAEQLWACLDGNDIYMASEIWNTVRADYVVDHELRHWLGGCAYGRIDGNHEIDSYWYFYRGVDIRY